MIYKTIITVVVAFIALVIVVPLILNAIGIDILQGGGGSASGTGVLFRSGDGGAHWEEAKFLRERRGPLPAYIFDVAAHPTATTTLFAGAKAAGLWKSEDKGLTWRPVKDATGTLAARSDVYRVVISGGRPETMYVAVYQDSRGRVLKSEDGGASFREIYFVGQRRYGVFDLATSSISPDTVMAATGEGRLITSDDGGRRWHFAKVLRDPIVALSMHPRYPNEGYLLTSRGRTYRTYDGGMTWTDLGVPGQGAAMREGNRRVIEHPYSRLAWYPSRTVRGSVTDVLAPDPHRPEVLYRTSRGVLLHSTDGGSVWQPFSTFIDDLQVPVGGVAVHPTEPNTLMVSAGEAVYTSRDAGINWSIMRIAGSDPLREIFIHPDDPAVVFIASGR
ncbi:MAG: hypothetical protein AAB533_00315 [Patescibacteria group bacterium]